MNFLFAVFQQTTRNLYQTWGSQIFTLLTITLSVLIFSFFYLVYSNMLNVGKQLGDDLRLVIYLDEEPGVELQEEYRRKILKFDQVDKIEFVTSKQAYQRFSDQLEDDKDVLTDMPESFFAAIHRGVSHAIFGYPYQDQTVFRLSHDPARGSKSAVRSGMGGTILYFYSTLTHSGYPLRYPVGADHHFDGGPYHTPLFARSAG